MVAFSLTEVLVETPAPGSPWPAHRPPLLDGFWTGYRVDATRTTSTPMRFVFRFRQGLVIGSGDDPNGPFHLFGVFGTDSGRAAILLTYDSGASVELDAVALDAGLRGWWQAGAAHGAFAARPLERPESPSVA